MSTPLLTKPAGLLSSTTRNDSIGPMYFDPSQFENAISYGRFSSPGQAQGQSLDRQTEALQAVLKRFGWRLLDQYFDAGISGGRGKHRATGALGRLLKRVRRREIPPRTVLVVETFDRLDREALTIAQEQFLGLINAGVGVYTTLDGSGYDRQSIADNPGLLFNSIGQMLGAHGVYRVMSSRSISGWEKRRHKVTKICPGWLRPNADMSAYEIVEGAQSLLTRIYEEAHYLGFDSIAARLNAEEIKPWPSFSHPAPTHWTDFHIRRIVTERLTRGELNIGKIVHQRKRQTDPDGEIIEYDIAMPTKTNRVIKDKYPAVISEMVWQSANAAVQARSTGRGRIGNTFSNLFQGLAKCALCGHSMRLHATTTKGKSYQYYRCSLQNLGGCTNKFAYNYTDIEDSVLFWSGDGALNAPPQRSDHRTIAIQQQIAEVRAEIGNIARERAWREALIREVAKTRKDANDIRPEDLDAQRQLMAYDDERDARLADIVGLEKKLAGLGAGASEGEQWAAVGEVIRQLRLNTLQGPERTLARARVNTGLKWFLSKITFDEQGGIKAYVNGANWPAWADHYMEVAPWFKKDDGRMAYIMTNLRPPPNPANPRQRRR